MLVGHWWVGPVALFLFALMLNSRVWWFPPGLSGTLHVVVPDNAANGEPRAITLDGSWDDLSPYYMGELGALYVIDWRVTTRRTGWPTPWWQERRCSWVVRFAGDRASFLLARGLPQDSGEIRLQTLGEKGSAAAIAALAKHEWPSVRMIARAMQGGPLQDEQVLWVRVALGIAGLLSFPVLLVWFVWLVREMSLAWVRRRSARRLARSQCPRCRYQLDAAALAAGTWLCPECGARGEGNAAITPADAAPRPGP
jgi:ssDNA-binding Zn-finger/Zn-ribbon topoisomerase 1